MSTRRPTRALNIGSSESRVQATSSNNNIKIFGLTVKEFMKKVVNFNIKKVLKVMKGFVADSLIHFVVCWRRIVLCACDVIQQKYS